MSYRNKIIKIILSPILIDPKINRENSELIDKRASDLYLAFVVSLSIHLIFFFFAIFNQQLKERLDQLFQLWKISQHNESTPVLIDLKDQQDEKLTEKTPFISQKNRNLEGKLTKEKGINLPDARKDKSTTQKNSQLQKSSSASIKTSKNNNNSKKFHEKDDFSVIIVQALDANNPLQSQIQSVNAKRNIQSIAQKSFPFNSRLVASDAFKNLRFKSRIDTKNLKIGSKKIPHADFHLELLNILKNRFFTLLQSNPQANTYFVDTGKATVRAQINQEGAISFIQLVEGNVEQPYFNYLGEKIVDNPGIITKIPSDIFNSHNKNEVLFLNLTVIFTGHPMRQWWFSWHFEH